MKSKNNIFLFKALGEETKYKIIELLINPEKCKYADGEYCACEIPSLIKRTQSNTSMHLAKLIEWNIIKSRRDGKKILKSRDFKSQEKRVCQSLYGMAYCVQEDRFDT